MLYLYCVIILYCVYMYIYKLCICIIVLYCIVYMYILYVCLCMLQCGRTALPNTGVENYKSLINPIQSCKISCINSIVV